MGRCAGKAGRPVAGRVCAKGPGGSRELSFVSWLGIAQRPIGSSGVYGGAWMLVVVLSLVGRGEDEARNERRDGAVSW